MRQQWTLLLFLVIATSHAANEIPPSCESKIYCQGDLLHQVQTNNLYEDSKHFVDLRLLRQEELIVEDFDKLMNETARAPTVEQLRTFVNENFAAGNELEEWTPTDYTTEPECLNNIRDASYKQFAKDVIAIWPTLGRKVKQEVFTSPELFSLIPISNGFIIPGGRFSEIYYWDSYWIIEGLILSGMKDTARGMIENLLELVKKVGHVPNGSRKYYIQRSQPPLLTAMVRLYYQASKDKGWLSKQVDTLEFELKYWLNTQTIDVQIDQSEYTLLRYFAESLGPRPESYGEDFANGEYFDSAERKQEFYTDMKSAAESGWDFSSRWFFPKDRYTAGNLTDIRTRRVIPVDLNAMFAGALKTMGDFRAILGNRRAASEWWILAKYWRASINQVLWNNDDGIWYDYDVETGTHRKDFYPSNISPLWAEAVEKPLIKYYAPRVLSYLEKSTALDYPGGVPTSIHNTGEQWDLPNGWPPLQSIVVGALEAINEPEASQLALHIVQTWIRSNYVGYNQTRYMFEKYDVETPGANGGGGEYNVQTGFGWSNGVVLEFLCKYGSQISSEETLEGSS